VQLYCIFSFLLKLPSSRKFSVFAEQSSRVFTNSYRVSGTNSHCPSQHCTGSKRQMGGRRQNPLLVSYWL